MVPDLVEGNLRQRDAVKAAVEATLDSVAGRTHDVIAVVPDAAVRVVLLEFDTLPSDSAEAAGVVRFRMKKSLPFDVDKARVSYHAQKSKDGVRVVAAVALASVVEDYEAAIRDAGYSPGVVLPSMLAALGAAEGSQPDAGGEGGCAHDQHCDSECGPTATVPHAGKHARRNHHRRATGGGSLSVGGVFSGYVSPEYREDFCGGNLRHGKCGAGIAGADRGGGAGVDEPVATGSERGKFRAALENGRRGGSTDFLKAVRSGQWSVVRKNY